MSRKDLHSEPFDPGTIAKLEIFEDYAQAWIPTFVMQRGREMHIFDFFAGPGYDCNQTPGSPIRILNKIKEFTQYILRQNSKIVLHFNEYEPGKTKQEKYDALVLNCNLYLNENPVLESFLKINYYNENSETLFFKLLPSMTAYPSLVYLDQSGVKFISSTFINELEKISTIDFLYFVSSSHFKRWGGTEEFKRVLDIEEDLKQERYANIHRLVLNKLKSSLPSNTILKLFPFSIKKGSNVYGIIFGSKHYLAVDKFLHIAWKRNRINGEANFDIDGDAKKGQLHLFEDKKLTKIEKFQADLEAKLLSKELSDNSDVLIFTYENGHLPKHASDCIKKLKGIKIEYDGRTPAVSYDSVFNKNNFVSFKLKTR